LDFFFFFLKKTPLLGEFQKQRLFEFQKQELCGRKCKATQMRAMPTQRRWKSGRVREHEKMNIKWEEIFWINFLAPQKREAGLTKVRMERVEASSLQRGFYQVLTY
jgi:hypothetical protein